MPNINYYYEKVQEDIKEIRKKFRVFKDFKIDIIDMSPYDISIFLGYNLNIKYIYIKLSFGYPNIKPNIILDDGIRKKEHIFDWKRDNSISDLLYSLVRVPMLNSFGTGRNPISYHDISNDEINGQMNERLKRAVEKEILERGLDVNVFMSDVEYISKKTGKNNIDIINTMFKTDCDIDKTINLLSN